LFPKLYENFYFCFVDGDDVVGTQNRSWKFCTGSGGTKIGFVILPKPTRI
jgi:hypothetical protein